MECFRCDRYGRLLSNATGTKRPEQTPVIGGQLPSALPLLLGVPEGRKSRQLQPGAPLFHSYRDGRLLASNSLQG